MNDVNNPVDDLLEPFAKTGNAANYLKLLTQEARTLNLHEAFLWRESLTEHARLFFEIKSLEGLALLAKNVFVKWPETYQGIWDINAEALSYVAQLGGRTDNHRKLVESMPILALNHIWQHQPEHHFHTLIAKKMEGLRDDLYRTARST